MNATLDSLCQLSRDPGSALRAVRDDGMWGLSAGRDDGVYAGIWGVR